MKPYWFGALALTLMFTAAACEGSSPTVPHPIGGDAASLVLSAMESPIAVQATRFEGFDGLLAKKAVSYAATDKALAVVSSAAEFHYITKPFPGRSFTVKLWVFSDSGEAAKGFIRLAKPSEPGGNSEVRSDGQKLVAGRSLGDQSAFLTMKLSEPVCRGDPDCDSHPGYAFIRIDNVVFVVESADDKNLSLVTALAEAQATKLARLRP